MTIAERRNSARPLEDRFARLALPSLTNGKDRVDMHLHGKLTASRSNTTRARNASLVRHLIGALIFLSPLLASFSASALQSVTLAWDANLESNLAGYKLYYGGASRSYTNVVNVGTALSAPLNLLEGGTYYFAVTAVNTQGAESDYSTEVSYSIPAIGSTISMTALGSGTINPNLNGQLLNVGWPYTVRAIPATGHAFRNWSGDISSTTANLTFVMQSNLTLVANFYDNARPQITIVSPAANMRVTNSAIAISGTASDNVGVSQVLYRFGNSPFQPAVGTTSWSIDAPLAVGVNVLEVKSVDTTGNESAVASRSITNIVMAPITVDLVGSGTIAPNYNGQLLEVGRSYTMSARAATGFTFSNWSGGAASTSPEITFVMQQGLSLTANFTDGSSPTIAVAAPLAGTRTTNSTISVRGTASDNGSVARVLCKVNDGPFETASGTTSWSGTVSLRAGTNRICVKAVDASGRESTELSRSVIFVVTEPIGLTVNGRGTITRRVGEKTLTVRSGQFLEIGKRYTLTATPAAGFIFTNWTGAVPTNGRTITFTMQSNTVLAANFVDVRRPSLVIVSPAANARLTNGSITLRGRAYDNLNLAQVFVSLNDAPFQPAIGTTNWSLPLNLAAGSNRIRVKALDVSGFESGVSNRTVTYVVMLPMTVGTSGSGTITPNLNGRLLEIGKRYSMTAAPGAGYILSNWIGSAASESTTLTFTMQSNANVTAQFVPNPFPAVQGTYNGLYYQEDGVEHHSSGFLRVTVTDRGSFSASLRSVGRTNAFTGQFNAGGRAQKTVSRTGLPALTINMQLPLGAGSEELSGTVSDGSWSASYLADRSGWDTTNNPYQGRYSLVLPGQAGDTTSPAGHGYGSALIDRAGNLLLSGRSADGQILGQSVPLSRSGEWPLYVGLYRGKGSILSWLTLRNDQAAPVNGLLSWIKSPSTATAFYRAGFSNELTVVGSAYVGSTTNRVIRMDEGAVIATDGNLASPLTNIVRLTPASTISVTAGTGFTMTLDRTTGRFTGSFRIPGTSTSRTFYGTLLQNADEGYGHFLGTDQSGQIRFVPLSQPTQ
jgi:uncharacterized repeat protein (TIGR02543 family)